MNLFGKKKDAAPRSTNAVDAILLIRSNIEMLDKREQHIQLKIDNTLQEAKEKASRKDKKGAIFCLKKKKMFEAEIEKLQGARVTLEQQAMSLEGAAVNVEVFKAVETGVHAMKAIRGNLDAARVDKIMDDIEEERDLSDQISDAITRPAQDMFDDEELLNELAELEELEAMESSASAVATEVTKPSASQKVDSATSVTTSTTIFTMPEAPRGPIKQKTVESEEEAALRELQASMMS